METLAVNNCAVQCSTMIKITLLNKMIRTTKQNLKSTVKKCFENTWKDSSII